MQDTVTAHAIVNADFASINPDSLVGKMLIDSISVFARRKKFYTDSLQLIANANGAQRKLHLSSEFFKSRS